MAEKAKTIVIDLIEPKFDPTHEVSRAMVEFNRFIQPYCEELEKKCEGIKIGTAMFNRKVWARAEYEDEDDNLLGKDHYLFSNLSSKFSLEKEDYGLFDSLLHSIQITKPACSDVECEKHSDTKKDDKEGLFYEIHKENWKVYIKRLNDTYKDIPKDEEDEEDEKLYHYFFGPIIEQLKKLLISESNFEKAFEVANDKLKKEEIERVRKEVEKHAREVLRRMIMLLRMPVLGGFPGTLTGVFMNELDNNKDSENDEGKDKMGYYSLRQGELVKNKPVRQLGIFEEAEGTPNSRNNAKVNKPIVYLAYPIKQEKGNESEDRIIFNILTKLTQLFVKGVPLKLDHIMFISVPIYKSYYPERERVSGTIAGFLQGWVFIPIELKKPVSDFVESLGEKDSEEMYSLKDLIEGCLIAGNMLVEDVRSAGARHAVSQANVDEDDISALRNSVHQMTGWKIENTPGVEVDLEGAPYQRWSKDKGLIVRLGNRSEDGSYEVDGSKKIIRLTKGDDAIFVKPLDWSEGESKGDSSEEDIYLDDLAQRLRTVHALILDKQERARGKADASMAMQEQDFAHELGQVTGLLGDKYVISHDIYEDYLLSMEKSKREERMRKAKYILSSEIFDAAKEYIYLWAPPKTDEDWINRIDKINTAEQLLTSIIKLARKAGFAYYGKRIGFKNYTEQRQIYERYKNNFQFTVCDCSALRFMVEGNYIDSFSAVNDNINNSSIVWEIKHLLYKAVAAACLNAIKHTGYDMDNPLPQNIVLYASKREIWIINSFPREAMEYVSDRYTERDGGNGSLALLRRVCNRVPVQALQPAVEMGRLTGRLLPKPVEVFCKKHENNDSLWCKTIFEFKLKTPFVGRGKDD